MNNNFEIISIKCYFSSILNQKSNNYNNYKNLFLQSIKNINIIISLLYDYLKLRLLYNFEHNEFNKIDLSNRNYLNKFSCNLLNSTNKKTLDNDILNFINNNNFYNNIPKRNRTTEILKEVFDNMITNIKVNIQEHYIQHLNKFIKLFIDNYDTNKDNKLNFYSFIYNMNDIKFNDLSIPLQQFYNNYINIFEVNFDKKKTNKPLHYNIKISPLSYLKSMYFINKEFEKYNNEIKEKIKITKDKKEKEKLNSSIISLFNILPSKNNYYNNYIPFNTSSLSSLLNYNIINKETKKQDKQLIKNMFNEVFNFNHLKLSNNLIFTGHFETDGIGCSLQFYNTKKKLSKSKKDNNNDLKYLEDLNKEELDKLKDKKIIGIDPGKYNILYMSDGNEKMRYTIHQRKYENGIFKRKNKIDKLKTEEIKKIETELSSYNSKTNDYKLFKVWLENKYKYFDKLYEFYNINTFRRLKMEIYQKTKSNEHKLIENIKNKFGNDIIMVFGDWSDEQGHRTGETTINKNIKRRISEEIESYKVDEYNTSKICCKCGNKLENYKGKFRLLICKDCKSREQYTYKYYEENVKCLEEQKITFKNQIFTRDINSCLNIIRISEHIIKKEKKKINIGREERKRIEKRKKKTISMKEHID